MQLWAHNQPAVLTAMSAGSCTSSTQASMGRGSERAQEGEEEGKRCETQTLIPQVTAHIPIKVVIIKFSCHLYRLSVASHQNSQFTRTFTARNLLLQQ